MLFLFPVKDGKLSTGVIARFDASCYGKSSIIKNYLTKQLHKLYFDNSAHFVLLFVTKNVEFATFMQTVMIKTVLLNTGSSINIE